MAATARLRQQNWTRGANHAMKMPLSQARLIAYSIVGTMLLVTGALVARVSVERVPKPLLIEFSLLTSWMAFMVVTDVGYHAWLGHGQARPHCGHVRSRRYGNA
jgi:hypothetical protein